MAIIVRCSDCGASLRFLDEAQGKTTKCKKCGCVLRIVSILECREDKGDGDDEAGVALGGEIVASDPVNNRAFKEADLVEFRAGSKLYVVWGVIYYSDVFGKKHYTRFCRYFKNGEASRWSPCQTGNDSD